LQHLLLLGDALELRVLSAKKASCCLTKTLTSREEAHGCTLLRSQLRVLHRTLAVSLHLLALVHFGRHKQPGDLTFSHG
jgi:hypothetical protein